MVLTGFGQDLNRVRKDVKTLSGPEFFGRGYVNDGSNRAADWLADAFKDAGMEPADTSWFQPFTFEVNTFPYKTMLSCDGKSLREGYDYQIDPISGSVSGTFEAIKLDSTDFQSPPAHITFPKRQKTAYIIDMTGIDTREERTALLQFEGAALERHPVIQLSDARLMWTVGKQQTVSALLTVRKDAFCENPKKVKVEVKNEPLEYHARNVIGRIPGRRSDSCIVITAHYDHLGMLGEAMYPGASDNASGTAMLLDLARYYATNPPDYDTWFIAFAGEEAGLLGSKYFTEHPLFPLSDIRFLINLDLMGSAAEGIAVVNGTMFPTEMDTLKAINTRETHLPQIKLRGEAANSDHYWFSEAGVPSIFIYTIGNAKAYHDVEDVYSGLDFANYEEVFTLIRKFIETL